MRSKAKTMIVGGVWHVTRNPMCNGGMHNGRYWKPQRVGGTFMQTTIEHAS
jgi:hypothetical protein